MNILYPQSISEAGELAAKAARDRTALFPAGSLSRLSNAVDLKQEGPQVLSCARLKNIEVEPDNLLAIAEAGLTPDEVDVALRPTGLYWPVSGLSRRTLGAVMAEGAIGAETMAHGAMPDWILGASFITASGTLAESGGRTLKNVSGYDYTRLAWRSFGRLGLCVRFILKLIPRPPQSRIFEVTAEGADVLANLAHNIIMSKMSPEALRISYHPRKSSLLVWFAGFPEVVEARRAQLQAMAAPQKIIESEGSSAFWRGHEREWSPVETDVVALMGSRKALLDAAETFARKKAALAADLDLGGGRAYLKFEDGVSGEGLAKTFGLTFDRFSAGGPVYKRLKGALDPHGLFFNERAAQ